MKQKDRLAWKVVLFILLLAVIGGAWSLGAVIDGSGTAHGYPEPTRVVGYPAPYPVPNGYPVFLPHTSAPYPEPGDGIIIIDPDALDLP